MNLKMVLYVLGNIMKLEGVLMLIPVIVSVVYRENTYLAFLIPAILLILIGFLLARKKIENKQLLAREGFVIVSMSWLVISLFGALPYIISGTISNFVDALFETISGFTTTGGSILSNLEALPKSILFWRSFTNWIGGMGVLVFILAFLPSSGARYMYVMRAEVPGPEVGKLVSKVRVTARILYAIYIALTAILMALLVIVGMPVFDSIVHAVATAGTGGFSVKNSSIAHYNSQSIEYIISVFMILFGTNFTLFYLIILGRVKSLLKNEELKFYLGIIILFILAISLNTLSLHRGSFSSSFKDAVFQVSSMISTTAYGNVDYTNWPLFSKFLIFILMILGGCAGSTAGGIKIKRLLILIKMGLVETKSLLSPRSVARLKIDGKAAEENVVRGITAYFSIYMMLFFISTLVVSLDSYSTSTTLSAVLSCLSNVGAGFGKVGHLADYSIFSPLSKMVLCFNMLAGRLELFPIILLFSPSTWRRV